LSDYEILTKSRLGAPQPTTPTLKHLMKRQGELVPNVSEWQIVMDSDGAATRVPRPFNCLCGTTACYGDEAGWFCTPCWLKHSQKE
jgi:hypothetical protein